MGTRFVGVRHFVAAASASVITAVSAWAFVSSTASIDRDPFQFGSIMAANAKVRVVQVYSHSASTCPHNPEVRDPRAPVCLGG
jgi:hypothetical protein